MQADPSMPPSGPPKNSPVVWIVVGVVGLCFLCGVGGGAILFPVFAQARIAAKMANSMANIKQAGLAVLTYKADFDDKFPLNMGSLSDAWPALQSYAKVNLPESGNPGHPEFLGNEKLSGITSTTIVAPNRTYEFFDSAPWTNKKRVMLYVDSRAKTIKESEFQDGLMNGMVDK